MDKFKFCVRMSGQVMRLAGKRYISVSEIFDRKIILFGFISRGYVYIFLDLSNPKAAGQ